MAVLVKLSIIKDAINIKCMTDVCRASPAWPRCPPGSWDLTSRGSRSSRPRRTCRPSWAPPGRSYCRQSGSWASSSSCSLVVGWWGESKSERTNLPLLYILLSLSSLSQRKLSTRWKKFSYFSCSSTSFGGKPAPSQPWPSTRRTEQRSNAEHWNIFLSTCDQIFSPQISPSSRPEQVRVKQVQASQARGKVKLTCELLEGREGGREGWRNNY